MISISGEDEWSSAWLLIGSRLRGPLYYFCLTESAVILDDLRTHSLHAALNVECGQRPLAVLRVACPLLFLGTVSSFSFILVLVCHFYLWVSMCSFIFTELPKIFTS